MTNSGHATPGARWPFSSLSEAEARAEAEKYLEHDPDISVKPRFPR